MTSRLVGILGGMGPAASADFYSTLVSLTPATSDQAHLRVVMWADPSVPNRQDAILSGGTDPTPWLRAGVEQLVAAGAEIVVAPCNTVHHFLAPLMAEFPVEFLDIRAVTTTALPSKKVALLATDGALAAGVFTSHLHAYEVVMPTVSEQRLLMDVVFALKAGGDPAALARQFEPVLQGVSARGANCAIVGCTELSVILANYRAPLTLIDPAIELAKATIGAALGERGNAPRA